jgi:CDP-4-dehydro-6-deoxyglucose reductase
MHKVTLMNGRTFHVASDQTILAAATVAQIAIPYSCKTGRCGACKVKVLEGITSPTYSETGLNEREKQNDWILSCIRTIQSDVKLEIDDLDHVEMPQKKILPCKIFDIKRLSDTLIQVFLKIPPTSIFDFLPGQYIDIIGIHGIRRSYSIAKKWVEENILELHIRFVENGAFSNYWFNVAKPNDVLRIYGPQGTFYLRDTSEVDLIFLATGTGIAPILAMLDALELTSINSSPKSVTLLWGCRKQSDIYIAQNVFSNISTFIPVLSRPDDDWTGRKGYVQNILMDLTPSFANCRVYACGSPDMIGGARELLLEAGLPGRHFYYDAFVCSDPTQ